MWGRSLQPQHASAGCARRLSTCEGELPSCLTEASQGPSGSAYNGPCSHTSLTLLHTMFQVPTLLLFPSTGALPAFQLHVLASAHQAQHKRRLLQEALLDNPP